jgi:hypothetical protein
MFAAKIAASVTGTADNCQCVPRENIPHELSFKYVLNDETPFIFLKSAKGDTIFTDKSYISVQGESSMGTKRLVVRADYVQHRITNVMFETAGMGMTDQDCELKFSIGGGSMSVDIRKGDAETAILYYRALCAVANAQAHHANQLALFKELNRSVTFQLASGDAAAVDAVLRTAVSSNLANSTEVLKCLAPASYKAIFEEYLGKM